MLSADVDASREDWGDYPGSPTQHRKNHDATSVQLRWLDPNRRIRTSGPPCATFGSGDDMSNLALTSYGSRPAYRSFSFGEPSRQITTRQRFDLDTASINASQSTDPDVGDTFELSRSRLQIRSKSKLRIDDEGNTKLRSRTHLRYNYEFQSDDGTTIQIQAKANVKFTAKLDADGDLKIRAKAKFQVSLLQQSVNSEAGELTDANLPQGALDGLNDALSVFNELVNNATSQFLDASELNGDGLIGDLVAAFNQLTESLATSLNLEGPVPEQPIDSGALPSVDEPVPPVDVDDSPVAVPTPTEPSDSVPPTIVEDADTESPALVIEPAEGAAVNTPVENVQPAADEPPATVPEVLPAETADPLDLQSLRVRLRLRFTESIKQLVEVFDNGETQTTTALHQRFSANLRLSARFTSNDGGAPEVPALDASA